MRSNSPAPEHDIEHRLTKPKHPWTNGQVERMNRTIKEATVKRYHYETPRRAANAPRRLRRRLQLRAPAQDPQRPHALRVHLQALDEGAQKIHPQSAPPNAGTKHLVLVRNILEFEHEPIPGGLDPRGGLECGVRPGLVVGRRLMPGEITLWSRASRCAYHSRLPRDFYSRFPS